MTSFFLSGVPRILQDTALIRSVERLSDSVVRLESFAGSHMEGNPLYKDYHGEDGNDSMGSCTPPHLSLVGCSVLGNKGFPHMIGAVLDTY